MGCPHQTPPLKAWPGFTCKRKQMGFKSEVMDDFKVTVPCRHNRADSQDTHELTETRTAHTAYTQVQTGPSPGLAGEREIGFL